MTFGTTLRRIALAAVSVSFTIIVGELALRIVEPDPQYAILRPGKQTVLELERGMIPGVEGRKVWTANSWGIRGEDFSEDQEYRILVMGGSTTICDSLDDREVWTHILQERLNREQSHVRAWVGNVGRSGVASRHHLLQVEPLLRSYPRIDALLLLIGGNDFLLGVSEAEMHAPAWKKSPAYRKKLMRRAFAIHPTFDRSRSLLWKRTQLARTRVLGLWRGQSRVWVPLEVLKRAQARRSKAAKQEHVPDLALGLEEYRRNLRRIVKIARSEGVRRVILVTQPALWHSNLGNELKGRLWMGVLGAFADSDARYLSVAPLAAGLEMYNRHLLSFCKALDLECIDLAPRLSGDGTVFYDDLHFTEHGASVVGEAIAEFLMKSSPFERWLE